MFPFCTLQFKYNNIFVKSTLVKIIECKNTVVRRISTQSCRLCAKRIGFYDFIIACDRSPDSARVLITLEAHRVVQIAQVMSHSLVVVEAFERTVLLGVILKTSVGR